MRHPAIPTLLVVLVLLGAPAWAQQGVRVSSEPEGAVTKAAVIPLVIPEAARKQTNPVAADTASLESGQRLYASQCTMCHGATGDGRGELALNYKMKMPDLSSRAELGRWNDGELFYILTNGHGRMPDGAGRLKDEYRWNLVNFVRTLPQK